MPLTVTTSNGTTTVSPQSVLPARVVEVARSLGTPNAENALAVTSPRITIDQRGLHWHLHGTGPTQEFSFNTGALALTLRQEVFIANDLSSCAQGVWAVHEQHHVSDNVTVLGRMPAAIAADSSIQDIIGGRRFPRGDFGLIQQTLENLVGTIFHRLTAEAVGRLDTRQEYSRVNQEILRTCPGPHFHTVVSGENLSFISQFYYGTQANAMKIHERNRSVIGSNPNLIRPGQRLELPRP